MAPFASKTFEELEKKIIDTAPVKVVNFIDINYYNYYYTTTKGAI